MIAASVSVHLHDESESRLRITQPRKPGAPFTLEIASGPGYGTVDMFLSRAQIKQLQAACQEALSHFQMEIPA